MHSNERSILLVSSTGVNIKNSPFIYIIKIWIIKFQKNKKTSRNLALINLCAEFECKNLKTRGDRKRVENFKNVHQNDYISLSGTNRAKY